MSLWEYKVITSGKGGFATPALLEKFLNDLGREEWEIIHFQTPTENFLAFTGLARRSTQRDWTLQDAAAAAAKAEAEKLRAEFEAKFKAAATTSSGPGGEERAPTFIEEKAAPDDGFRKPVDTSRDDDPEAQEDEKADEWDKLTAAEEDDLPTFFEAIKPHMRRNQRGPGMSVGVDYLAKKWDQSDDDLKGALVECGFVVPTDEDSKVEYVEYDGDLFWLNINRRGELWINTKEKPRPVFRPVKAARIEVEAPAPKDDGQAKPETGDRRPEAGDRRTEADEAPTEPKTNQSGGRGQKSEAASLPQGPALLDKIRPHMRRNRRGPGGSGSTSFLSRAMRTNENDLKAAFVTLGLTLPTSPSDKPVYTEIGRELWWMNLDSRGGLWINGRERKEGETAAAAAAAATKDALAESGTASSAPAEGTVTPPTDAAPSVVGDAEAAPAPASTAETTLTEAGPASESGSPSTASTAASAPTEQPQESVTPSNPVLTAVRSLLKETKAGATAGKLDRLAEELGKSVDELTETLVAAGLKVPEKPREKPVFVEQAGELLWLNRNAKGELWLNAKAAKFADREESTEPTAEGGEEKPRRGRTRKKEGDSSETDTKTEPEKETENKVESGGI